MQNRSLFNLCWLGILFIPGLLCGCAVGPDYVKPVVEIPAKFKEAPPGWKKAEPLDCIAGENWWKIFNDYELNALLEQVDISNQNIAVAEAQYRQAVAVVDEARSAFFPTLAGSVSFSRQKLSTSGSGNTVGATNITGSGNASTGNSSTKSSIISTQNLSFNAAWEPDLWGSVRRTVEAAKAGAQSDFAQIGAVRLSMRSLLAQSYFSLRTLDITQKLLNDSVKAYQTALQLTKNRYKTGVAARLDVVQAETQLETAQTAALDNNINRAQFEHAVAVLIGKPPAEFSIKAKSKALIPPEIPPGVPSELLERRPDIAVAERLIAEANANIGVAISAYYPVLTLTATDGFSSTSFSRWLSKPAQFWTLGAQLAETLFDGGLRNAKVKAAWAIYDQNAASYKQTILTAFQNVEDELVALNTLKKEAWVQQKAVANAKLILSIVMNQYKAGTAAYSEVIVSQNNFYSAQQTAVNIEGRRMAAAVGLIMALGGGWDVSALKCAAD